MNSSIDSLNMWGARFLDFAVPMWWQSSLLIAAVFTLDFLFRRKIRAAIRYSFWFVVFVKLVVPPTLALPTGAAWWLRGRPVPATPSQHRIMAVHYSDVASDYVPLVAQSTYVAPPAPKLSREGWVLILAMAVSGLLAVWLILRWRHVAGCVRGTTAASEEISEMLAQARRQAGMRRSVALRVTSEAMSPAVCGLFKPVILLP
ncbi:MAG TPA: M56 family metallopeptidase, partial [Verrucomicrobiae bacterium]|nr:M56 family metallopeptidase [Verrucomicrobiae bacterium]